ncbi:MAG TPA: C4-dicarboxylate ABC transporter substrate-binding protein, partial [Synergistales bacterium]|nr:C4-dicarboxylate ABC transporter substrate-binding protein [Synergistales bacterium]
MARKLIAAVAVLALVMGMAIFMAPGNAMAAKEIVVKLAHNGNTIPEDPQNIAVYAFKKMVEERSGGAIRVDVYPAAQLGDARTIVEGVQMGTI